jgi:hypothetical protein
MRGALAWWVVAAGAVTLGCGGGGAAPVAFTDLPAAIVAANCHWYVACGMAPDMATCLASYEPSSSFFETMAQDLVSNKVTYDAKQAGACEQLIENLSCLQTERAKGDAPQQATCNAVFKGTVAPGGACFFAEECAAGGACVAVDPTCSVACCAGVCTAKPTTIPVGRDCAPNDPSSVCADGSTCVTAATGSATCVALPDQDGADCTELGQCAGVLVCSLDDSAPSDHCHRPSKTGELCDTNFRLCDDSRDHCDFDTTPPTCQPYAANGATCGIGSDDVQCPVYAACDGNTNKCMPAPAAGEPCANTVGPSGCLGELTCDPATYRCALPAAPGACQ